MNLRFGSASKKEIKSMLLIDMSNLVYSEAQNYFAKTGDQLSLPLLRNLVISRLKEEKTRHHKFTDEIVLCFDGKNYWRKQEFPYYKSHRSKARDDAKMDWALLFESYDSLKKELRENFPFRFIELEGCEADDIIASLCRAYGNTRSICIVSSDKDFIQIQQNIAPTVKQWSIFLKKYITPKTQKYDLFEHIIRGDPDDGIPNFLSDADTFVSKEKRQKSIRETMLKEWRQFGINYPEKFVSSDEQLENFNRNKRLIDLREIPDRITNLVLEYYNTSSPGPSGKIFNYLVSNRMTRLLEKGAF